MPIEIGQVLVQLPQTHCVAYTSLLKDPNQETSPIEHPKRLICHAIMVVNCILQPCHLELSFLQTLELLIVMLLLVERTDH